jgi:hypothetical protein
LDTLLTLSEEAEKKCQEFALTEENRAGKGREEELLEFAPLAAIPAATMGVTALSGLLSSVGDVIGLFRSDYELKGQTLTTPEDIYIQAMVADRLRKANRDVYLIDFQAIKESNLIRDLNKLIKQN